jgi:two-component system, OmpR family, phosphate regulon sensor histidine kinase PhoR
MQSVSGSAMEDLERRVAERTRELAEANERLGELDRLKDQFVSNVSHELRTPLTNIKLYLDLLQRGRPDRRDHYLAVLERESDRLQILIDDLLDLSRLDIARVKGTSDPAPVDLAEVVGTVLESHAAHAEARGVTVEWHTEPALAPARGQRNQLAQVVTNLVANAINYTPRGGHVGLDVTMDGATLLLEVADTGVGIPPEERPHVFDRFYRGERARALNVPGTGLGLAIVKEIVDLHGGQVALDARDPAGTRVEVRLPRWEA